jgi:hypothetical protein
MAKTLTPEIAEFDGALYWKETEIDAQGQTWQVLTDGKERFRSQGSFPKSFKAMCEAMGFRQRH